MSRPAIVTDKRIAPAKLEIAREFRGRMTACEELLWDELRAGKTGFHFRRQQVVMGFIVDFMCRRRWVIVEVDGEVHDDQQEEDARRDAALQSLGFVVLRFQNEQVMRSRPEVVRQIVNCCESHRKGS